MTFLNKLQSLWVRWSKRIKQRDFRASVMQEKRQKYLFRDELHEKHKSKRVDFIFRQKRAAKPLITVFQKLKKDRSSLVRIMGWTGIILLSLSSYIIFVSPYFKISPSQVLITPFDATDDKIIDLNLAYKSVEDIYNTSVFLINKTDIIHSLKNYQKNIKDVEFDVLYPNGVKIILYSFLPKFDTTLYGIEKMFVLTENGVLIPGWKIQRDNMAKLEIVDSNLRDLPFLDYKSVLKPEIMSGVLFIEKMFQENISNLKPVKFRYFSKERELHIVLESGTHILINLDKSIPYELWFLKAYQLQTKTQLTSGEIFYIDARIPGKIFRCDDKNICRNNLINTYGDVYR